MLVRSCALKMCSIRMSPTFKTLRAANLVGTNGSLAELSLPPCASLKPEVSSGVNLSVEQWPDGLARALILVVVVGAIAEAFVAWKRERTG
jgi:hypothetical protein